MFSYVLLKSDVEIVENPLVFKDFGISRGGRAHVARMVLFDRDSSYVVHGCWFASKGGEMKSLDFTKSLNSYGFLMISARARAQMFF